MRKYINRNDLILILSLIMIPLAGMILMDSLYEHGDRVLIYVDDELRGTYPLDEDEKVTIRGYGNGSNTVMIEDGRVYMDAASCPDRLCIHQGHIDKTGQMIVCLPNRVVVKIQGSDDEYDAFTR